jgi:hypothetical protein
MPVDPVLLVLDYPGRRPEAHISEMDLERGGFDCAYVLASPLPTELTTSAYASQLCVQHRPDRPFAVVAYCAAAPLAVAMAGLLPGSAGPLPIVLLDPQQTPPHEIEREYHEVVRQVEGRTSDAQRPPLLDIERLLASPEVLVERIGQDLRLRARLALAAYGFEGADVGGPADGVVGMYVEWLTFLVAAHHDEQAAPRGPILQVISRGHPADASWLGDADVQTARIRCDRSELAAHVQARAAVLDFLYRLGRPASAGMGHAG